MWLIDLLLIATSIPLILQPDRIFLLLMCLGSLFCQSPLWFYLIFCIYNLNIDLLHFLLPCRLLFYKIDSLFFPSLLVLILPWAAAPAALSAHSRWSSRPLQTFAELRERGRWWRSSPSAPCQGPLTQPQVLTFTKRATVFSSFMSPRIFVRLL